MTRVAVNAKNTPTPREPMLTLITLAWAPYRSNSEKGILNLPVRLLVPTTYIGDTNVTEPSPAWIEIWTVAATLDAISNCNDTGRAGRSTFKPHCAAVSTPD